MSNITFLYQNDEISIQCKQKENLLSIFQKFCQKVRIKRENLCFLNNGKMLTDEMTEEDVLLNQNKKKLISVIDNLIKNESEEIIINSKEIICPKCQESATISIEDFHITISNCKNSHKTEHIQLKDFENTQKMNISKIICQKCNIKNMGNVSENLFYRCFDCKINLCPLCKTKHNQKHLILNYLNKMYICEEHGEGFISFCFKCKKNLCFQCGNKHNNHEVKYYNQIVKDNNTQTPKEKIDKFRKDIDKLKYIVSNIINKFNQVIANYEYLYKIKKNILENMDKKFRNYQSLINKEFIDKIEDKLENIINSKKLEIQILNIIKTYQAMTKNENSITLQYKIKKGEKKLKIFGEDFVKNNKDNCQIILENKEHELSEYIDIEKLNNSKDNIIEIKLMGINDITKASCMFYKCSSLISLSDFDKWNSINVTDMYRLFSECSLLKSLPDISKWNTNNLTNMGYMFSGCSSLKSLPDISKWDTSKVTFMGGVFYGCSSLLSLPDISKWNTENVTNLGSMFYGCSSLVSLPDINKWNINRLVFKDDMFSGCSSKLIIPQKFK